MKQNNTKYPAIWLDSVQRKLKQMEQLRLGVIGEVKNALDELQKKYQWDEAYIFGSLAKKDKFQLNSDVDIALSGLNKLEHYEFIGDISEILNRKVDVVRLEDCNYLHSIIDRGIRCKQKSRS